MIATLADFSTGQPPRTLIQEQPSPPSTLPTTNNCQNLDKLVVAPSENFKQEHFVQIGDICNNSRTAQLAAAEAREKYDYKSPVEIWPENPDFVRKKVMRVIR